jgi:hypothetical protein
MQSLSNFIVEVLSNFSRDDVKRAYIQFSLRLEEAVAAECNFIR